MEVKELNELLEGVLELSVELVYHLKDGAQIGDAIAIWDKLKENGQFKAKLERAYNGVSLVDDEIKDLDFAEGLKMGMLLLQYIPRFIEAAKK